ncbi:MAG: hypothetical protein Kow0042_16150 [Calditrichia bacterium]
MTDQNLYEALVRISEEMSSVGDMDLLLNRVMDIAMTALQAERGFILLKPAPDAADFEVVTARNMSREAISSIRELSSSVVNQVLKEARPVLTYDAQTDQRFAGAESVIFHKIKSIACTPLILKNQVIGAIYMDSRAGSGKFDEESLKFLQAFSRQAAIAVDNARFLERIRMENEQLRRQVSLSSLFPQIIGRSPQILKILEMIRTVANSSAMVLIEGESGTGKELVARALHYHSERKEKPFIPLFCGSLSENLMESELFGHKKGAFTGALENKTGLFEEAHGGTLFLDEIAEINQNIQTKLLRVIQEGEIKRVGESQIRKVDVRIISATNKDLKKEVEAGRFREDLYYRLNVINIKMPPLRERREDIPLIASHFLKIFAEKNKKNIKGFSREAMERLLTYQWPGNIRELVNTVERAVILSPEPEISPEYLHLSEPRAEQLVGKTLKEIQKQVVLQTLEQQNQNRTKTAEILGVSRRWLQYHLKEWGLLNDH